MESLRDNFGRKIDYLRISVTDRCNLRCIYCMPEYGIIPKSHQELLSFEEIVEIVKVAVQLGIDKIRITGGEPLVRKGIIHLVKSLSRIAGIKDLSMTTNGTLLKEYAFGLKKAGLKRLNLSLDSLNPERYKFITRWGNLDEVKGGISKAIEAGFSPLKINAILLGGINEDEVVNFLNLTLENIVHIRFLEYMPINSLFDVKNFVSGDKVLEIARGLAKIEESQIYGYGPARVYKFKSALGTFGIISPLSNKFCAHCNRLRLTSDGFLKSCLHSDLKVNLRDPLRKGAPQEELIKLIKLAVHIKPQEHSLDTNAVRPSEYSMCQIGG